ncbi:PAS domain S-box protein [Pedobacter sp. UYP1]|uniref:PAS domain S-box protein n=1 Tax=Pedobacter sp. UYP1 TaxID=1756396 RepID=UPI003390D139
MELLPIPENETERLRTLKNYEILNSLSEEQYDRITALAASICEVPISLITLIDEDRQWFKSKVGLDIGETARSLAFCQYTIMDDGIFEVTNARADERFRNNELVTGDPHIMFYAGYPLIDPQGYKLGTLCVIDRKPNQLSENQKEALRLLSLEVMQLIVERRLKEELKNFEKLFLLSNDLVCVAGTDGYFKKVNPAFKKLLGWSQEAMLEKNIFDMVHPDDSQSTAVEMERLKSGTSIINFEHRLRCSNGEFKFFQWVITPEKGTDNVFGIGRDITKEKANEEKLAEKEASLRAVFENSQGFLCTHDLQGNFMTINNAGASILGYNISEIEQMSLFDIVPAERHPYLINYLNQIQQEGHSAGQMLVYHKDGSLKTLMFNNVLEIRADRVPYVIGNALDITEQKSVAARLLQVTEMLEQTNQVARVGGWQMEMSAQKIYWTSVTRQIHELPDEVEPDLETAINFYKEGANREEIQNAIQRAVDFGESWEMELQIITYTGKEVWVKAMGNSLFEDGVCKRLYGSFQDIDKRKKAELEVAISRAILSSFASHAPAAVAMLDNQMRYIAVSNRWLDDYGMHGKNILGTSYYDYFSFITDEGRERHKRILNGTVERKEEDVYLGSAAQQNQYINWEMRPWWESEGVIGGMMIFTQDVTAAVLQRNELNEAKIAAEQASIAKSDFLANMSHEIRTPLNGVIGFTDLVLKTDLNETQLQYLSIVNQSAIGLLGIINDILDFSKIEAGKLELDLEECDIYEISGQATDIITYQIQKKGLEMLLNLSTDLPRFIWADSIRLKQILVNLMGNAAKFTEKGEIELKIEVLQQQGDLYQLRFSVRDTGIGIKEDQKGKIFEAFAQEDASTTKRYGGTGLGLAITNKLLAMMGTKLELTSTLGVGSEFFFEVWMKGEKGEPKQWENISWIKKVLIVDDNENNRIILDHMLLLKEIISTHAKNGFEALQLLASGHQYDLILMDYHMPYLDGLDTIRQIRETFNENDLLQPIVLLFSSSDDEKVMSTCEELKVNARISKPVKMEELYNLLSHMLLKEAAPNSIQNVSVPALTEKTIQILVADDNAINMLLAKTIIKRAAVNAEVIEARNGLEVIECFKNQVPDLILMDVQMPEMNGYEATIEIRKLEKGDEHVPIIALTAGNVKNEKERCTFAGMDDFVVKPVIEDTIVQVLKKWLHVTGEMQFQLHQAAPDAHQHFDPTILKSYIGDDTMVLAEILALTKEQLKNSLSLIKAAVEKNQLVEISAEGHKIYGTAVSAGLPRLAKLARELELEIVSSPYKKDLVDALSEEIYVCVDLM